MKQDKSAVLPARLVGVPSHGWAWLVATLEHSGPLLVVVPEAGVLEGIAAALENVLPGREVLTFPAWDVQPYDRMGPSAHVAAARLAVIERLAAGKFEGVIVSTVAALGVREVKVEQAAVRFSVGDTVDLPRLPHTLVELGYKREDVVQERGDFAVRGGIVDVWPASREEPVRMELFDDEIDSLRAFDPASQKSLGAVENFSLGVAQGVVLDEERVACFRRRYRELFPDGVGDDLYVAVSEGILPPEAGQFLPLFHDEPLPGLLEQLPDNTLIINPENVLEQAALWDELVRGAYEARREAGGVQALPPEQLFVSASEMAGRLGKFAAVEVAAFDDGNGQNPGIRAHSFAVGNRHGAAMAAAREVTTRIHEGWHVVLSAASAPGLAQFLRALEAEDAPSPHLVEDLAAVWPKVLKRNTSANGIFVAAPVGLPFGWVDARRHVLVLTEGDVFGTRVGSAQRKRRKSAEELIAHFSELHEGDYVVHEQHGIGKFGGLVTVEVAGLQGSKVAGKEGAAGPVRQDFLKIFYADDDRLFVPVENLDVLSRYKGAEAGSVVLDKLGTGGWQARKEKVREDLMAMAGELLATAAAREAAQRTPVERSVGLYDEFCAGFPYPLTEDQERVMAEVEDDLLGGVPMDRLVVGDVGFGKTEVALRSAFLMAAAGRQVAVVCPTTLLARQHYAVFTERFAGFPLRVGRLSRLVPAAEAKQVKLGLATGSVDIVVGTHALLGTEGRRDRGTEEEKGGVRKGGLEFHNLGLVIVDEEQRFGVAHKEKLKQMRAEVDVLTLTATPIPRTLQMAVGGVRQLSLITTPPVDRQAVQTFVLGWDNVTLKGAITRELVRGGQVYVVAPHIEDLPRLEDDLRTLVPDVRLAVAHGQMAEGQLEDVMSRFYEGDVDILLATTIIESGLDVPRANTLIVYRADRFGLAQLYQLRGRVGRSTARAFAYFLLPDGGIGEEAVKRLQILQRLDGLGAGFQLASYDMDLRGFGNILGKQQSGHIRDIGFELYAKMLKDAVQERQKRNRNSEFGIRPEADASDLRASSVTLKLGVSYLIPEGYVPEVAVRMQLYRRLANLEDSEGVADFRAELLDRFGSLPDEVQALLAVVDLRNRASALNINKIDVGEKGVVVAFENGAFNNPEGLMRLVMGMAGVVTVRPDSSLVWHRRVGNDVLRGVGVILSELESIPAGRK